MKLAPTATRKVHPSMKQFQLCIGLEPPPKRSDDDESISFTCKMNLTKKDSPEFSVTVYKFGDDGTAEQLLETLKLMQTVERGQAAKKNEDRVSLIRQVFEGSVLTAFENELPGPDANGNPVAIPDEAFKKAINAMKLVVFPDKAARNQKKAMAKLKKPRGMSFREWANRLKKMNDYLPFFPLLPDGSAPSALTDDALHEILHDSLPWEHFRAKMQEHQYDPTEDSFHNFIDWVERTCEPFVPAQKDKDESTKANSKRKRNNNNDNQSNGNKSTDGSKPNKKQRKFCMVHKYCDHTTEECKVVKASLAKTNAYNKSDKSKDFHAMMAQDEVHASIQRKATEASIKACTEACNKLFKAFKRQMEEDFHLIEKRPANDISDDNENQAYLDALQLNQASDDNVEVPSDEEIDKLTSGY